VTPTERGELVERLLPIAAGLACIVHGDGDQRDIAHVLTRLNPAEQVALIVILAGLVDPEAPLAKALGYITWDETGRPAATTALPTGTIRDIAVQPKRPSDLSGFFREEQKTAARIRYHQLGDHQRDIATDLGIHERTVSRWVNAPRERVSA